jgi:prefoldin subunit 5
MSTLDEITKAKQRLGEALARVDAQREKLSSQLTELGGDRACARALHQGQAGKEDVPS